MDEEYIEGIKRVASALKNEAAEFRLMRHCSMNTGFITHVAAQTVGCDYLNYESLILWHTRYRPTLDFGKE